jgi:hypothetical protein
MESSKEKIDIEEHCTINSEEEEDEEEEKKKVTEEDISPMIQLMPILIRPKEDISKICGICHETVSKQSSWIMRAPCCGAFYHGECMEASIFLPSRKLFYCARCLEPKPPYATTLIQKKKMVRKKYLSSLDASTIDSKQALDMLHQHLQQNIKLRVATSNKKSKKMSKSKKRKNKSSLVETNVSNQALLAKFQKEWERWLSVPVENSYKLDFLKTRKPPVRYNTLLSLGWTLEDIYLNVTNQWDGLVTSLGFGMSHLYAAQKHVNALVALFDVDVDKLRESYGRSRLTIQKIQNFQAETLSLLGFSAHRLCTMCGLIKPRITVFANVTMEDWVKHLELRPIHVKLLRIKHEDFSKILARRHWNANRLASMMEPFMKGINDKNSESPRMIRQHSSSPELTTKTDSDNVTYFENIILLPSESSKKIGVQRGSRRKQESSFDDDNKEDDEDGNVGQVMAEPKRYPRPEENAWKYHPHYMYHGMQQPMMVYVPPTPYAYSPHNMRGGHHPHDTTYYSPVGQYHNTDGSSTFRYDDKTSRGHWIQPRTRSRSDKKTYGYRGRGRGNHKAPNRHVVGIITKRPTQPKNPK